MEKPRTPLLHLPAVLLLAGLLAGGLSGPAFAADGPLANFPLEIACGVDSVAPPAVPVPGLLADLPFDSGRGYGYVGGRAVTRPEAVVFGGDPRWPVAFREAPQKYSFRVPNGRYLLRLVFIETEVAAPRLRVFDVRAGAGDLLAVVDIVAEAGDFVWLIRECLAEVRDGWLDLRFDPAAASRPAVISRLRIERAEDVPASPRAPKNPSAEPGPGRVVIRWDPPSSAGIAGYGVFRADSPAGPYESLTAEPIPGGRHLFADERRSGGEAGFYRVRAYGALGGQSPFSAVVQARAGPPPVQGLRSAELEVAEVEAARLLVRSDPPDRVPATLFYYGSRVPVELSCLAADGLWQAKKSWRVEVGEGSVSRRRLLGRRQLFFLAEAGDPTLLREKLASEFEKTLGLTSPQIDHLQLLLNGRYQGLCLDREELGPAFRRRTGLDRFGMLARAPGRLRLEPGWRPYGQTQGQSGDLRNLFSLVHELSRTNEGEVDSYFEERFYLDRLISRLAAAALRGADPALAGAEPAHHFLEDSRNGKWEVFSQGYSSGDFGIEDFRPVASRPADGARARRSLWGWSLFGDARSPGAAARWRLLETRLLARPAIRDRYLARVEEFAREIDPQRFDDLATAARAPVAAALLAPGEAPAAAPGPTAPSPRPRDLFLWPDDGGAAFRGAPALLSAFYREHHRLLLEAVSAERARRPGPLALNELLLRPAGEAGGTAAPAKDAWIEILNRSGESVDLGDYFLTDELDRPERFRFPRGTTLSAGERRLVAFGSGGAAEELRGGAIRCALEPSPEGGELGLFRAAPGGSPEPADFIFYGRQTAGLPYARLPDGAETWGHAAAPTPGAENRGPALPPPPWRYRNGVDVRKSGGQTLWIQFSGQPELAAGVSILLREEGAPKDERRDLPYNKETYRWEQAMEKEEESRRFSYYFIARTAAGVERAYPLPGPVTPLISPVRPPVFINEILPRPLRGGEQQEFLELYNAGDQAVSVDGMFLSDDRRSPTKFRISAPDPIPPRGFLVLFTDGRGEGLHANFRLGNGGEYLALHHRVQEGNVIIDQLAFPPVPLEQSYGRERDGARGFKVWKYPTPGARNLPRIPPEHLRKEGKPAEDPQKSGGGN